MSVSRRLAFACLILLVAAAAQAAGHTQLLNISDEIGAVRVDRAEGSATLHEFTPAKFERAFVLESGTARVMLRPVGARSSAAVPESRGIAYRNAFRGVDVLRSGGDTPFEAVVARDRAALESIAYEIAEMRGVIAAVPSAGGIRFVTANSARDVMISAPMVIDANGRPAANVRWAVSPNGAAGHGTLHLSIRDAGLRYPVKVVYSVGGQRPRLGASRRFGLVALGTGSISGSVTDAVTSAPAFDAFTVLVDSLGEFIDFQFTDSAGGYFFSGLDTGSYRVFAAATDYVSEVYNNIPCDACDLTTGTPVSVTNGVNTGGINFALTPILGRVSGQITAGTAPGADVVVVLYDNTGNAAGSATADASGFYEASVIAAGSPFKARTFNSTIPGYLDQLYNGIDCGACPLSSGTAISVSAGLTTPNINFSLHTGGQVAGTVTDTVNTPIYQANLNVYDSAGVLRATTQSDLNGNYLTPGGLQPGNYFVLATAFAHGSELYNNISCNSCNVTTGTAVAVAAGATTGNINFSLRADDVPVSGVVTDATTSAGLANVTVLFYNSTGTQVSVGVTDGTGHYATTLADGGTYYARTDNSANPGYVEQLYNNIDCSGCNPTTGTAITATAGSPITGINFALRTNGGSISGHVSDSENSTPVAFANVAIYNSTGVFVTHATADTNGDFSSFDELAPGTYYATASASGYATQLYLNLNCATGCVITNGTAITVLAGQATTGVNFSLAPPFARIIGTVKTAANNTPIGGASVTIYDSGGSIAASVTSDVNGLYLAQLSDSGTYFATAVAAGFQMQLYNGQACAGCDPLTGDPISATIGGVTPDINFLLTASGCPIITVNPSTLPNGTVSQAYSATVTSTGGAGTVTFAVLDGDLPDGLTLTPGSGLISGTPTAAGAFVFTISATDANGCSGARTYHVEIAGTDTPTTTVLTVSINPAIYGDTVTLTATVSPDGVSGTVTFRDGSTVLGSASLNALNVATLAVNFNAGTHSLTATYEGAATFAPSTSNTVSLLVNKADPSINWNTPASITYPTALSSTQLNATVTGIPGTFVYTPVAGTVLNAGSHNLSVLFTPNDTANYNTATSTVPLTVLKGTPVITWVPADYTFGTPLGAAQLNATANVPGTFTYNPPAGTILPAGTQTISSHFTPTDTANYNEVDTTVSLNGAKAQPLFSDLSAPVIIIGTASTTIGGKISLGTLYPTGSVDITLNGVTQSAAIQADGTFSSAFATSTLVPPSYPIAFNYPGDDNFLSASATSTLTVRYGTTGERISNGNGNSGSTIPFRVKVFNANNVSLASPSLQVTAYGVRLVSSVTWLPAQSNGNQGPIFDYQNAAGGSYQFTLKTTGLAAGNYVFGYKIGADATIYTISFTVK